MKKLVLSVAFTLGCILSAVSQVTVKGTVTSKTDQMPIPGVSVMLKGGGAIGTATDFDGNFLVEVPTNDGILVFSFIGYAEQEVNFRGNSTLAIELQEAASELDEVVLIGYGTTKKGDLTSAISTVENIENISSRPVANLNDFLQGNVPGVTVLQQGGDPTSGSNVVIRGLGSFASESPLTVVDGVPYYGPAINPNDIASVSVLKDASAAAIYGAQAASGVIVIQTKKGKIGKPRVSIDYYGGIQEAMNLPTPLAAQQQAEVYNLAADNAGSPRQSAHDAAQNPYGQVNRTNWVDAIFRAASIQSVNASISGAGENANYLTSFNYFDKEGLLEGTSSDRYSFRVKSDFNLSDKITVGENVYFSRTEALGTNTDNPYSGTIINAVYMPSAAPTRYEDGSFAGVVPESLSQFAGAYGDVYNPLALLLRPTVSAPTNFLNANVYGTYDVIKGLTLRSSYAYSYTQSDFKRFQPRVPELGRSNPNNFLEQSNRQTNRWVWDNQLSYKQTFGGHSIDLTAIYSAQHTDAEYVWLRGDGFSSEEPFNQFIANASIIRNPESSVFEDRLTSAIGRAMYNFKDRYYLSGSIRRDKTSRLAVENQSDNFPSVSAGWRVSKEPFFKVNAINDLKFRGSWGQIGNINSVGYYSFDVPLNTTVVTLGEDASRDDRGAFVGKQSNPNLNWEVSESINLGMDATLFNNTLSLTFDYFEKTTKGMILPGLEDLNQGTKAADVNGGEVKNTGFEIAATYTKDLGDFRFAVNGNISVLDNELVNLDGYNSSGIDFIAHSDNVRNVLRPYRSEVGRSLYSVYVVPQLGIFQSQAEIDAYTKDGNLIQPNAQPGDFKFADANDDGKIDEADKVFYESYQPDFTYNLGLNLAYKNFDVSMLFQGVSGVDVFNGYKYTTYNASLTGYNLDNRVLNAWTPQNTTSNIPRLSTKDDNRNFGLASSWYLEDASYLRMKNITVGYNVDSHIMNKLLEGSSLRIYISAENLFTLTDYSGLDPEVGGKGLDIAKYPLSRTVTGGLSLKL
ncbi:TonB-dependent receptor [Flavobacterium sp. ASW18X]|uniref:SusC/RagA family TonB-linked outer membrane protein n=1 Tax=Flavobacterium sp. ASW18X TaxID=2572595 RepID=UPI0010AE20B7|nr:TonB-dependent receptor [Flavobacterium sp. ASW18X]TKD66974.1 TonB-dependent receptor [Flavobacterium sp. ASW18X]